MTDRREIGQELVRIVTRVSDVLGENGRLRAEIARLRVTDAEREALQVAREILGEMEDDDGEPFTPEAEAIGGLLERLG